MGKRTVRHDLLRTCPVEGCGRELRPCNVERHVRAAHPGSPELGRIESERIGALISDAFREE